MLAVNTRTVPTRYGDMTIWDNDVYIGHALDRYGEYSEAEAEIMRKIVKEGDHVADIGANIGVFTLALMTMVGKDGKVLAFEPQPQTNRLLCDNVQRNDPDYIVMVFDCGLSDTFGVYQIPAYEQLQFKNYGGIEIGSGAEQIAVKTLDSFEFKRLDFAKIDVEGMERQVLIGATETIKRCRPVLYVENDRHDKVAALIRHLTELDYELYQHLPLLYADDNYNKAPVIERPRIVSPMLLCLPRERAADYVEAAAGLSKVSSWPRPAKTGWAGICRFGGIGDNLIAASVLRPLKAAGFKVEVLSQEPQACVFDNNPFIDKLSIKSGPRDLPPGGSLDWQKWFWARGNEYDRFVNLSHSCENLGALFPASTAFWWPTEFRRKLCSRSYLELVHDIVGVPYQFGSLFFPTDAEKELAETTKQKLSRAKTIGWCITGTRVDKVYPLAPVAVARLIKELHVNVVLLGAPQPSPDFTFAKQTQEHVIEQNGSDDGLHLALSPDAENPSWPIRRILTFTQACDLVIGPDTGPLWAVAMEEMPKITLVSHASAENITKHWRNTITLSGNVPCHPCHRLHDGIDTCIETQRQADMKVDLDAKGAACMRAIAVETIVAAAQRMLS